MDLCSKERTALRDDQVFRAEKSTHTVSVLEKGDQQTKSKA